MSKDLLIEIGTEEMPARFISNAVQQLADRISKWLNELSIKFQDVKTYSTPRRLTVVIKDVAERQEDRIEEAKGPSIKIAKDDQGNWTKAAQGFARGQGVSLDDLMIKEIKNVEYIFAKKEFKGNNVEELLPSTLEEIIKTMTFPKNMRWGSQEQKFVRPIKWILALFDEKVIPIKIAGVNSNSKTFGHRFLGNEVEVTSVDNYQSALKEQYVIADTDERRAMILSQIKDLEKEKGWQIPIDEELLDEIVYLVEYPTVLFGSFKEEFLEIPSEVLTTTMKEHQRYFSVKDKSGKLLPYFITVRNGDARSLQVVRKGNEKVLTARLADAKFFYVEDHKLKINDALSKLENVVFQEGLGSIGDKVRRINEISEKLAELLKLDNETSRNVSRTAEICKFDLVTNLVYEFPELQGLMGEKYAKIHGENEVVSRGVFEHYLPRSAGDDLPESIIGQLVSIADKIDNIVGSFLVGKVPTGSQDPLGLRRQAAGIVQLLLEKINDVELKLLFDLSIEAYDSKGLLKRSKDEILADLNDFFTLRIRNLLQEKGIRYDVIDAVLETDKNDVKLIVDKAIALTKELEDPAFKHIVDSFTRVLNIAKKADKSGTDPKYYLETVEHDLYTHFMKISENLDSNQILDQLKTLKDPIEAYFDKVMIMVEDKRLRQQRLGLLMSISNLIKGYADFNKLVFA